MYSDHDAEGAATSAHDRLREASERFRIVLENSAVDMQTTLGSAHSAVDSGVLAIKAHLDAMALRLAEIEKTLQPLGARFETVGQQAADLGSTLGGLGEASGELNEPLHALGRSLEGLEGKLEDARRRLAELADALSATLGVAARVEEVAASLDRSLDPLDRFASSTRALPDVGAQATALASAMADGQSTIEQFIASVRGADAGMQRVAGLPAHLNFEALESLSGTLERQIEGLNVSVRTWQKGVIDLDTLVGQLVQRQRAAAEALLQVQDELKASVHILTTSIEGSPV
jgi:chromosome segregation ATPase